MSEELIQIYNAVRRSHLNIMHMLVEKVVPEMTVENVNASEFQQTIYYLLGLVYFNAQKNVLLSIKDIQKQQGIRTDLIEEMIMERDKEVCQSINNLVNATSVYKNNSPVPLRIAKAAKEQLQKIERLNREIESLRKSGSLPSIQSPTAQPLRPA